MKPNLELYNHLEEGRLNSSVTDVLIGALESCLPSMLALPEGPVPVLSGLDEVEISVVSDDVIRDVHARFLNDPTATDVITFPHGDGIGEIIVSFDTAIRQASEFGEPVFRELFRYMVHGLLHLHGYIDTEPEERERMFSCQEPLVRKFGATPWRTFLLRITAVPALKVRFSKIRACQVEMNSVTLLPHHASIAQLDRATAF